ncbi:N-acetylglucosamine kinase [Nakamurella sp. PAMC28650]|uniref:N-acetylglucosamine kinase n=1 Tax=Nakamurella sp. PAMC28650 TaxID=2762325 RepID=UPI00164E639C|nr:BadF/BadG/BcrA/BcrD ATPase family protein [Nakamurella sp. PAMC28650]QNK81359.1 ATPase [Nakamurella sp. PAMC28650]
MTFDTGRTVLALDGGNSKTDAAVVTSAGEVLARGRGRGFRPHLGKDEALAGLGELARSVLVEAGLQRATLLSACLANSDLPREDEEFATWFTGQQLAERVEVTNDVFALLRSGTRARAAVTVVCGAGMNCVGVAPDGSVVRFLALGTFTGDWGGGGTLGTQAMFFAMRDEDGRGARTELSTALPAHFGYPSTAAVAEALHLGEIDGHRLHELVPVLFAVASAGDEVALSVVRRQADEVIAFVMAALTRLGLLDTETEVVLGGGVLAAQEPVLLDPILAALGRSAPHTRVTIPRITPIVGSVLLGLEHLADGAPVDEETEQRIRVAFGEARKPADVLQSDGDSHHFAGRQ